MPYLKLTQINTYNYLTTVKYHQIAFHVTQSLLNHFQSTLLNFESHNGATMPGMFQLIGLSSPSNLSSSK